MGRGFPVGHVHVDVDGVDAFTLVAVFPTAPEVVFDVVVGLDKHLSIFVVLEKYVGLEQILKERVNAGAEPRDLGRK